MQGLLSREPSINVSAADDKQKRTALHHLVIKANELQVAGKFIGFVKKRYQDCYEKLLEHKADITLKDSPLTKSGTPLPGKTPREYDEAKLFQFTVNLEQTPRAGRG